MLLICFSLSFSIVFPLSTYSDSPIGFFSFVFVQCAGSGPCDSQKSRMLSWFILNILHVKIVSNAFELHTFTVFLCFFFLSIVKGRKRQSGIINTETINRSVLRQPNAQYVSYPGFGDFVQGIGFSPKATARSVLNLSQIRQILSPMLHSC